MPAANFKHLADVDELVFYTEFGLRVVESAFQSLNLTPQPPMHILPHGVDTTIFHPLVENDFSQSRKQARLQLFPDRPHLEDAFIVLNANRNNKRKRVDLTMQAFAEFAKDKPDAYLYLHMGMRDYGYDIPALTEKLNLDDRLLRATEETEKPTISDEQLNVIYNACDIGINTSLGEGWGLVAFEHAATGAAQIVPAHSAGAELWRDYGYLVELNKTSDVKNEIAIADAAMVLQSLYQDRQLLDSLSARAFAYANSEKFSWQAIAEDWRKLLS
ncbi:MAG: glycosyltransferase [Acidobacteriota bacterium]